MHNRWLVAAALLPLVGAAVFGVLGLGVHRELLFLSPMFVVGSALLLGVLRITKVWRWPLVVRVEASREGLKLDGKAIARAQLRSGFVLHDANGRTLVRIQRRWA